MRRTSCPKCNTETTDVPTYKRNGFPSWPCRPCRRAYMKDRKWRLSLHECPFAIAVAVAMLRQRTCQRVRCGAERLPYNRFCADHAPRFYAPPPEPGPVVHATGCRDCGAPVAPGVVRCSEHRRPAFFSGSSDPDRAWDRDNTDADMPGETRRAANKPADPGVRDRVRRALAKYPEARVETLARASGLTLQQVRSNLSRLVEIGHARTTARGVYAPTRSLT